MFSIKVEFTGGEKVYKFKDDQEVLIGKGDNCQVKLEIDGISRQHMKIYSRNGDYFCQDLGSTNGSYINDDKLEPNTETAFTSFFPIRLGFDVFVNLLDEVDPTDMLKFPDPAISNSTVSKTEVDNSSTKKPVNNRASTSSNSKNENVGNSKKNQANRNQGDKKKAESKSYKNKFLIICIAIAAYVYFVVLKKSEPEDIPVQAEVKQEIAPASPAVEPPKPTIKKFQLSPEEELLVKNSVAVQKCMVSEESDLCKNFGFLRQRSFPEGVISKPTAFIVVFDVLKTLEVFKKRYKYTPKEAEEVVAYVKRNFGRAADKLQFKMTLSLNEVPEANVPKLLAVFEFLYLGVNKINPQKFEGKPLILIPIINDKNNYKVIGYFKPELEKLRSISNEKLHFALKLAGITGVFKDFDEYFP